MIPYSLLTWVTRPRSVTSCTMATDFKRNIYSLNYVVCVPCMITHFSDQLKPKVESQVDSIARVYSVSTNGICLNINWKLMWWKVQWIVIVTNLARSLSQWVGIVNTEWDRLAHSTKSFIWLNPQYNVCPMIIVLTDFPASACILISFIFWYRDDAPS